MDRRIQLVARAGAVAPLVSLCRGAPPEQGLAAGIAAAGPAGLKGRGMRARGGKAALQQEAGRTSMQEQASGCLRRAHALTRTHCNSGCAGNPLLQEALAGAAHCSQCHAAPAVCASVLTR